MTYRRRYEYYFGWAVALAALISGVGGTLKGEAGLTADNLLYLSVMLPLGWLAWLATAHPKVVVNDAGVSIVNWFVRYDLPWSAVAGVSGTDRVTVELRSGQRIHPASGSPSLVGTKGRTSLRRHLRDALEEHQRTTPTEDLDYARIKPKLDIKPLHTLATALLVLLLVWLLGLT